MKSMFLLITVILISLLISSCSGNSISKKQVLAEVNGQKILLDDIYKNPAFVNLIDQYIKEKIIRQEFEARKLVLKNESIDNEWNNFVKSRGQEEEVILRELKKQGVTKAFIRDQIKTQVMYKAIIENEFPSTIDEARKEFEGNLSANQKMYSGNVPDKVEDPDSITFEDVSDVVLKNMKNRVFTREAEGYLDTLTNEYKNQGWIKNFVKPEEIDTLTTIKPKTQVEQVTKPLVKMAPVLRGGKKKQDESEPVKPEETPEPEENDSHD